MRTAEYEKAFRQRVFRQALFLQVPVGATAFVLNHYLNGWLGLLLLLTIMIIYFIVISALSPLGKIEPDIFMINLDHEGKFSLRSVLLNFLAVFMGWSLVASVFFIFGI